MEDYKKHFVDGLYVSENEYKMALEEGTKTTRVQTYRDGELINCQENSPITIYDKSGYFVINEDMVNSPSHYTTLKDELNGLETIDILEIVSSYYPQKVSGHVWNALKYLFRAPFKGKLRQDIEKAVWYLNRALKRLDDDVE